MPSEGGCESQGVGLPGAAAAAEQEPAGISALPECCLSIRQVISHNFRVSLILYLHLICFELVLDP